MRSVSFILLVGTVSFLGFPRECPAQEGAFAFQIQGGWTLPLGDFREGEGMWQGESGQGPNFTMGFTFPAPGPFGAFLGFGQRTFGCDPAVCPDEHGWTSTGFDVALRWVRGEGRVRSWVQGGLHTNRIEGKVRDSSGRGVRVTSDGGGGVEIGAGALVLIGRRTSLVPGVRYGWGEVPFPDRGTMKLRYLVLDVGILMGF